jgi:hypothetical protein
MGTKKKPSADAPIAPAGVTGTWNASEETLYAQWKSIPHVELSSLARMLLSAAGVSEPTTTKLKPAVVVNLASGWFVSSDGEISVTGLATTVTVPVNLHLGHAFMPQLVLVAGPSYVVTGSGQGNVTLDLQLNVIAH